MIHADLSPDARPTRAPAAASRIFFITKRKRVRNTQKKPSPGQTYFWVLALAQFVSDGREIWRAHADEASQRGAARTCEVRLR